MFNNEKEALIKLFVLNNYDIYKIGKTATYCNDNIEIIETIECQLDLKYDLNKLFNKLTNEEQTYLMNYIEYGNKHKAAKECKIPYTTYRRKLKRILKKWETILKTNNYIS